MKKKTIINPMIYLKRIINSKDFSNYSNKLNHQKNQMQKKRKKYKKIKMFYKNGMGCKEKQI